MCVCVSVCLYVCAVHTYNICRYQTERGGIDDLEPKEANSEHKVVCVVVCSSVFLFDVYVDVE